MAQERLFKNKLILAVMLCFSCCFVTFANECSEAVAEADEAAMRCARDLDNKAICDEADELGREAMHAYDPDWGAACGYHSYDDNGL